LRLSSRLFALLGILVLAACQTSPNSQIAELKRPTGASRIVLMPVDVELSELTAGGLTETKADWTELGKTNLVQGLEAEKQALGIDFVRYDEDQVSAERRDAIRQFVKLHGAIGSTILIHQYGQNFQLPTKHGKLDWTLGESVNEVHKEYGADYAMFVYVRDSYASSGRVALMVTAAVLGVGIPLGQQVGFVSLVDLDTGNVVWFNRLLRGTGDLRTATAAQETAHVLLTGLPK
jgi:hypothetical protein